MRWSEAQLSRFEARRSANGTTTTAIVRTRRSSRKPAGAALAPSELHVHFAVADHLGQRAAPGVWWSHFPAGALRDGRTAAKLKAMGTRKGVPDFLLLIGGRLHGLELKRHHGRLSSEQRACHREIEAAGGFVHTAHGIDEALAVLGAWGALGTLTQSVIRYNRCDLAGRIASNLVENP